MVPVGLVWSELERLRHELDAHEAPRSTEATLDSEVVAQQCISNANRRHVLEKRFRSLFESARSHVYSVASNASIISLSTNALIAGNLPELLHFFVAWRRCFVSHSDSEDIPEWFNEFVRWWGVEVCGEMLHQHVRHAATDAHYMGPFGVLSRLKHAILLLSESGTELLFIQRLARFASSQECVASAIRWVFRCGSALAALLTNWMRCGGIGRSGVWAAEPSNVDVDATEFAQCCEIDGQLVACVQSLVALLPIAAEAQSDISESIAMKQIIELAVFSLCPQYIKSVGRCTSALYLEPSLHANDWRAHSKFFAGRSVSQTVSFASLLLHQAWNQLDHCAHGSSSAFPRHLFHAYVSETSNGLIARGWCPMRCSEARSLQLIIDTLYFIRMVRSWRHFYISCHDVGCSIEDVAAAEKYVRCHCEKRCGKNAAGMQSLQCIDCLLFKLLATTALKTCPLDAAVGCCNEGAASGKSLCEVTHSSASADDFWTTVWNVSPICFRRLRSVAHHGKAETGLNAFIASAGLFSTSELYSRIDHASLVGVRLPMPCTAIPPCVAQSSKLILFDVLCAEELRAALLARWEMWDTHPKLAGNDLAQAEHLRTLLSTGI